MPGSAAYGNPTFAINKNTGNVTDSSNVWNNCEISVPEEKRKILEWLSPMAPRGRHQAVREGRVDGVGNWFLGTNEFQEWHTSEDQAANPVLFCCGDPGVGKTFLSSLVIDTLCDVFDEDKVAVACYYCNFHAHKEQSATSVLGALLKQLVAGVVPIPEEMSKAFDRAKRKVDGRAPWPREILAMFSKTVSSLRRAFICIDALDEFPTNHRPGLWESLQLIVRECPNVRIFITGRPHIRAEVKKYFPGYPDLPAIKPTTEDIGGYLAMRLKKDSEPDAMDAELKADIFRIIPENSTVFLLVSLIMDAILGNVTIDQRRKTLREMTNGLGLDDAYGTTLSRITEQKGKRGKLGMEALMWVSCSERPLKAEELCHALAAQVGTTNLNSHNVPSMRALLSCTLGLVTIDDEASTVRPVHFTLQEYLAAHPNLFTTPHAMIAEICLTYLNFQSICDLSTSLDSIPLTAPFFHYASRYWGLHAKKEITENVKHLALQVLERSANHIPADIPLHEKSVCPFSREDRFYSRHPNIRGLTGLHYIAYMGITEIAIAMVNTKIWDLNGLDSQGATPLILAVKCANYALAKLLLEQGDVDPTLSDNEGLTPLIYAAKSGNEDIVKLLLERVDINPDSSAGNGRTPLSYAAGFGHERVVKALLERRDVKNDSPDKDDRTPLSYAAESESEGVVKAFLETGDINPDSSDKGGRTPLSYAAMYGNQRGARALLERGDVNPDSPDNGGRTPLSYAAQSGGEDLVRALLERGDVNPDSSDRGGQTPLSYAAGYGREGVVKALLERGDVNPDSSDNYGRTPLLHAADSRSECVVKALLERGDVNPDSSDEDGRTPLSHAALSKSGVVAKILLERGDVNPDSLDNDSRTPLSYAAEFASEGVVKALLESGDVNPDSSDRDGQTPVSYAAQYGCEGVVKALLECKNVNPDSADMYSRTPLSLAARYGREGVVKMLLECKNVHPDSSDEDGRTPLSLAARYGHEGVVKELLERKNVNTESSDMYGRTPLSYGVKSRNEGVVKALLGRGDVNPNSSDRNGRTPLSYATKYGNEHAVKLLRERGGVNPDLSNECGQSLLSVGVDWDDSDD